MTRRHALGVAVGAGMGVAIGGGLTLAPRPAHAAFDMEKALVPRIIGNADAPIHIAEYFSLSCGHCADFHGGTFKKIKADWVATGRARFEYRDFPLGAAAVYAHAIARAAPPAAYDGMLTTLFARREEWLTQNPVSALQAIARRAGIGGEDFNAIIGNRAYLEAIVAIGQRGHDDFGIDSTPSFVINGREVIRGNVPYKTFTDILGAQTDA